MSSPRKAWMVAVSIGAVEALKDQGIATWNYPLKALQQRAKSKISSVYQYQKRPISQSIVSSQMKIEKMKRREKNVAKAMELNCLGPSTVRF